jgi:hypothetical protein
VSFDWERLVDETRPGKPVSPPDDDLQRMTNLYRLFGTWMLAIHSMPEPMQTLAVRATARLVQGMSATFMEAMDAQSDGPADGS